MVGGKGCKRDRRQHSTITRRTITQLSLGRLGHIWALFLDLHSGCICPLVLGCIFSFSLTIAFSIRAQKRRHLQGGRALNSVKEGRKKERKIGKGGDGGGGGS